MPALRALFEKRATSALVLALFAVAFAFFARAARGLEPDPDPFSVLPAAETATFREVAGRYGALDVAIVGVEPSEGDVFSGDLLARLKTLTKELNETPGVATALSLTSVEDTVEDEKGGSKVDYLVREAPTTDAEREALRKKVLSRELIVGNLVSADGKALVIYGFLAGGDTAATAALLRSRADEVFAKERRHYWGAPYLGPAVLADTARDVRRFAPIGAIAAVLVLAFAARSFFGVFAAALPAAFGAITMVGVAALRGYHPTPLFGLGALVVVAASLPLGLAAVQAIRNGPPELGGPARGASFFPTLAAAGLAATAVALGGLVVDHPPLRAVFQFAAFGLAGATLAAVLGVPALHALVGARVERGEGALAERLAPALDRLARGGARSLVLAAVLLGALGAFLGRRARYDQDGANLFGAGSETARAEAFFREKLGGSQFVQVEVRGDVKDPAVLREMVALADQIEAVSGVVRVEHVGAILSKVSGTLTGEERLPDTQKKLAQLFRFLEGRAAVRQFVDDERTATLLQVKLASSDAREIAPALSRIEVLAADASLGAYERVARDGPRWIEVDPMVRARRLQRFQNVARRVGSADANLLADQLVGALSRSASAVPPEPILAYLASDECTAELPEDKALRAKVATTLGGLDPRGDLRKDMEVTLKGVLPSDAPMDAAALAKTLATPLRDLLHRERARLAVEQVCSDKPELGGDAKARVTKALVQAVLETEVSDVLAKAASGPSLAVVVTGQPTLDRALSGEVRHAHDRLGMTGAAIALVLAAAFFRSRRAVGAFLGAGVAISAIAVTSAAGLHLDLGSAAAPPLAIGVGLAVGLVAATGRLAPAVGAMGGALASGALFVGLAFASSPPVRTLGVLGAVGLFAGGLGGLLLGSAFARGLPDVSAAPAGAPVAPPARAPDEPTDPTDPEPPEPAAPEPAAPEPAAPPKRAKKKRR